jgi:hypothetical protein
MHRREYLLYEFDVLIADASQLPPTESDRAWPEDLHDLHEPPLLSSVSRVSFLSATDHQAKAQTPTRLLCYQNHTLLSVPLCCSILVG